VLAFVALAVGACGAPEEAKPRPLPEEPRKLGPGTYRTEEFEPAFSFRVGEGWSVAAPEAYDVLRITQGHEDGGIGFANLEGAHFYKPTNTGTPYMTDVPKDVVGWFQGHPYLETQGTDPVKVGGSKASERTWSWGTCREASPVSAARGACPSSGSAAAGFPLYCWRKTRPA
jgi:hypothetical protein